MVIKRLVQSVSWDLHFVVVPAHALPLHAVGCYPPYAVCKLPVATHVALPLRVDRHRLYKLQDVCASTVHHCTVASILQGCTALQSELPCAYFEKLHPDDQQ